MKNLNVAYKKKRVIDLVLQTIALVFVFIDLLFLR